jgi:hypothetical protein
VVAVDEVDMPVYLYEHRDHSVPAGTSIVEQHTFDFCTHIGSRQTTSTHSREVVPETDIAVVFEKRAPALDRAVDQQYLLGISR